MHALADAKPTTSAEFKAALLHFVNVRLPEIRALKFRPEVDGSTNLFDPGPIDSLGILDLIAFIEKTTAQAIPTRLVTMKHFATIDNICDAFWTGPSEREV